MNNRTCWRWMTLVVGLIAISTPVVTSRFGWIPQVQAQSMTEMKRYVDLRDQWATLIDELKKKATDANWSPESDPGQKLSERWSTLSRATDSLFGPSQDKLGLYYREKLEQQRYQSYELLTVVSNRASGHTVGVATSGVSGDGRKDYFATAGVRGTVPAPQVPTSTIELPPELLAAAAAAGRPAPDHPVATPRPAAPLPIREPTPLPLPMASPAPRPAPVAAPIAPTPVVSKPATPAKGAPTKPGPEKRVSPAPVPEPMRVATAVGIGSHKDPFPTELVTAPPIVTPPTASVTPTAPTALVPASAATATTPVTTATMPASSSVDPTPVSATASVSLTPPINPSGTAGAEAGYVTRPGPAMRPLALMVENHRQSRPHTGLAEAEVIYEMPVEGGITRFMALYYHMAGTLGPVRSCRPYFPGRAFEVDAMYAHCGSSAEGYEMLTKLGIPSLDEIAHGGPFFRDSARKAPHNLYTKMPALMACFAAEIKCGTEVAEQRLAARFGPVPTAFTTPNRALTIRYHGDYTLDVRYNAQTRLYERYMNNELHRDRVTSQPVAAAAVIVQEAPVRVADSKGHLEIKFKGAGRAYYCVNGMVGSGRWSKETYKGRTIYTDDLGNEIVFPENKTLLIQVVGPTNRFAFDPPLTQMNAAINASASATVLR